jgi:Na+-transporting NADH:ubiquinone oxidoreductase subunit NqrF
MSDTLLGVLIGGLIGSAVPLSTLIFNHLHWKQEAKLTHLTNERSRLEQLFEKNLERLGEAMANNSYSSVMSAEIAMLMPKRISVLYNNFMDDSDHSEKNCKIVYLEIALAMNKSLAETDRKIAALVS